LFGLDAWAQAIEIHRRLAFVPGDVNLWPNLTGGEVIDLFLAFRGAGRGDKAKRAAYLERFDLDPSKKCRTYSKGNRQKVALIAAFASDVELFVLDEPTSGLDPLLERVFQDCVQELKQQGKSVFLSSHILSEVEALADHISIIREGKIIESGTMAEISQKAAGRTLEDLFLSEYAAR
jgi:ABC-2 type transport system ATP-binding protein